MFGVILLIVFAIIFSDAFSWADPTLSARNQVVFERKNQAYGAFLIRRNYTRSMILAMLAVIGSVLVILLSIAFSIWYKGDDEGETQINKSVEVVLAEPPPIDESEPPPPPPPPPPPVETTVKFVPPVVTDEEVAEEQPIQEELSETKVSTVTQEGTGDEEIIVPEEPGNGVVEEVETIHTVVQEMPEPPGGNINAYLAKNINYPAYEKDAGIQGTVFVEFVVGKEGDITDVKVLRGIPSGPGLEKEAIRVIKTMPKWKPGRQAGRAVPVRFTVPIKFTVK